MIDETPGRALVELRRTPLSQPRLRVLFVTSMWPDRTMQHYGPFVASQARSLEARGIGVDVLVIRGYSSARAYLAAIPRIVALVKRSLPDIVHVHTGHAAVVSLVGIRPPKVVSFVGGDLLGHTNGIGLSRKSRIEVKAFRRLAHLADATITKSTEMETALPPSVRARNFVIPNGVDLHAFRPMDRGDARAKLGWAPAERVALFMGDPADPRKNFPLARAAVDRLGESDLRLHVGWGSPPSGVPTLMSAADVLVFPSTSEGSPNVVKEAMACALPVVATPVGDVPERFAGVDGCFVTGMNSAAFAAAISDALTWSRAPAARDAIRPLELGAVAERIERIYLNILTAQGARNPAN